MRRRQLFLGHQIRISVEEKEISDSGADRKARKQRKKGGGGIESLGFHDMQISRVRN